MTTNTSTGSTATTTANSTAVTTGNNTQTTNATKGDPTLKVDAKTTETPVEPWRAIKHKVKIDGAETEVAYDDLIKDYQMSKVSLKKMQDASQLKQQMTTVLQSLKAKDLQAFKDLEIDPVEWAESILTEKMASDALTPEQKELKRLRDIEAQTNRDKADREKAAKDAEDKRLMEHYQKDISDKIVAALQPSGLPVSHDTVKRVSGYMIQFINAGHTDITPADVIPYVREDYEKEHAALWSKQDVDKIIATLGKDTVNAIIKTSTKDYKESQQKASPKVDSSGKKPFAKPKTTIKSLEKFMKDARKAKGNPF